MTARWGDPVRRRAAPVMVAAPAVSTDDVTRLLERREARPIVDEAAPTPGSPVDALLARREARVALAPETLDEDPEDEGVSPVEALLARRAASRADRPSDVATSAAAVAALIAAREAQSASTAPPAGAVPLLDALLSRRDARTRTDSHPEETP